MNLGGRKFMLAAVSLLASIVGLFADKITGDQWFLILGVILGAYGAANVTQKIKAKE